MCDQNHWNATHPVFLTKDLIPKFTDFIQFLSLCRGSDDFECLLILDYRDDRCGLLCSVTHHGCESFLWQDIRIGVERKSRTHNFAISIVQFVIEALTHFNDI